MSYIDEIEAFFLEARGRGMMLSPADTAIAADLEKSGVPAEVACRGIARAFELASSPPRSLSGCLGFIEAEVDSWRSKEIGRNRYQPQGERSLVDRRLGALLERIADAGKARDGLSRDLHRLAYRLVRETREKLRAQELEPTVISAKLLDIEGELCDTALESFAQSDRMALEARARDRVPLRRRQASARAFAEAARAALEAQIFEELDLVRLALPRS